MSPRPRVLKFLGLLVAAAMVFGVFAGTASAKRYTSAQKKQISAKLMKQIKRNPAVIKNKKWIAQANHVEFKLPVTIRLNPHIVYPTSICTALGKAPGCAGPITQEGITSSLGLQNSDDSTTIDLGPSLGAKTAKLAGQVKAWIHFRDPLDNGGRLGDVDLEFANTSSAAGTATVRINPLSVLTNTDVTSQTVNNGGCSDRSTSLYYGGNLGALPGPLDYTGASDLDQPANAPYMGGDDNQNAVLYATGHRGAGNPNGDIAVGISSARSGGTANILGLEESHVSLGLDLRLWTALRGVDIQNGNNTVWNPAINSHVFDPFDLTCRTAITGYIDQQLNAKTGGGTSSVKIAPAFTLDHRFRIAKIDFNQVTPVHNTVQACLQPFEPLVQAGPAASIFNWDHGTTGAPPTTAQDDLTFPVYSTLAGQIASTTTVNPNWPGFGTYTATSGSCNQYPNVSAVAPTGVTGFPTQDGDPFSPTDTCALLAHGCYSPSTPDLANSPNFSHFPYLFTDLQGPATDDPNDPAFKAAAAAGTIEDRAVLDADVSVNELTGEVLVGQSGINDGPSGP